MRRSMESLERSLGIFAPESWIRMVFQVSRIQKNVSRLSHLKFESLEIPGSVNLAGLHVICTLLGKGIKSGGRSQQTEGFRLLTSVAWTTKSTQRSPSAKHERVHSAYDCCMKPSSPRTPTLLLHSHYTPSLLSQCTTHSSSRRYLGWARPFSLLQTTSHSQHFRYTYTKLFSRSWATLLLI